MWPCARPAQSSLAATQLQVFRPTGVKSPAWKPPTLVLLAAGASEAASLRSGFWSLFHFASQGDTAQLLYAFAAIEERKPFALSVAPGEAQAEELGSACCCVTVGAWYVRSTAFCRPVSIWDSLWRCRRPFRPLAAGPSPPATPGSPPAIVDDSGSSAVVLEFRPATADHLSLDCPRIGEEQLHILAGGGTCACVLGAAPASGFTPSLHLCAHHLPAGIPSFVTMGTQGERVGGASGTARRWQPAQHSSRFPLARAFKRTCCWA